MIVKNQNALRQITTESELEVYLQNLPSTIQLRYPSTTLNSNESIVMIAREIRELSSIEKMQKKKEFEFMHVFLPYITTEAHQQETSELFKKNVAPELNSIIAMTYVAFLKETGLEIVGDPIVLGPPVPRLNSKFSDRTQPFTVHQQNVVLIEKFKVKHYGLHSEKIAGNPVLISENLHHHIFERTYVYNNLHPQRSAYYRYRKYLFKQAGKFDWEW